MVVSRPHIKITVGTERVAALVDTGACATLMDYGLYMDMIRNISQNSKLTPSPSLCTLTGAPIDTKGSYYCNIGGLGCNVVVVDKLGIPLLIGTDLLKSGGGRIDYYRDSVVLGERHYPFVSGADTVPGVAEVVTEEELSALLDNFSGVFHDQQEGLSGAIGVPSMSIETEGPPIFQRAYRAPLTKRQVIDDAVDEMLSDGVISPSNSPWASPVTLAPKKDGGYRVCINYRRMNAVTKKDRYPLPHIQDIFDTVGCGKIFTTLDLKSGYWQLPVAEADREKTAFVCHRGQFQYNRVSFGLANAPSFFQRTMNHILAPLLGKCVLIYIDDLVIYSSSKAQHLRDLEQVFVLLDQFNLKLKRSKCEFGKPRVELLGYQIDARGIAPLPEKTAAIRDLPAPRNLKTTRSFLGLANYYRQCMPNYAHIAEPMVNLTRKGVDFNWTNQHDAAFQSLKGLLVSSHVMAHPDVHKPYKLYTDACDYAIGGILCQVDDQGVERVIQYISHQLNPVQRRWATIEKEAYAVVYALQKLRPYLLGADFVVYTDHKPLKSLFTKEMNNTKIQRWAVLLAEYGAQIEYRQGKNNIRADMLSRIESDHAEISVIHANMADPPEGNDGDVGVLKSNDIKPSEFRRLQQEEFATEIEDARYDEDSDYTYQNRILYSERRPYVGAPHQCRAVLPEKYRKKVIKTAHQEGGHMAASKTMKRILEQFVWPGMRKDIRKIIKTCATCEAYHHRPVHVEMQEIDIPPTPMQVVGVDLIGPFVPDQYGRRYLMTIIDYLSGWAEAIPIKDQSARECIEALTKEFLPRHGNPLKIINDNGQGFKSAEWARFLGQAKIELSRITPGHPQGNAKVERLNKTLKSVLAKAVENHPERWSEKVGYTLAAYNTSVSDTTGYTPFFLLYGRRPRVPLEEYLPTENLFGNRLDDLAQAYRHARESALESRQYNRRRLNARANVQTSLQVGDTVTVTVDEPVGKLTSIWDPEYEVIRVRGTTHWLRHQQTGKERKLHREKLMLVDPDIAWDELPPRSRRQHGATDIRAGPSSARR